MSTFSVSPIAATVSSTGNTLALVGVGTGWTSGTTFTVTDGSVTAKTYVSATSYTLTYTAAATSGSVTISDGTNTGTIAIYPTLDVAISPASVVASSTGSTVTLTGTGTSWGGGTTFTASGGTITATTINSTTSATLTYTAPARVGQVLISDGTNGGFFAIAPTLSKVIASDNFYRANTSAGAVGNNWIDNSSLFKVLGAQLTTGALSANFNNRLYRPTGEAFANGTSRIHFGPNNTSTTNVIGIIARASEIADNIGLALSVFTVPGSTNSSNGLSLNQLNGTNSHQSLAANSTLTIPEEGWLELILSGNSMTGNVYQADGVTLIGTINYTGALITGTYLAAGPWGVLDYSTGTTPNYITEFDTFATAQIAVSPLTLGLNSSTTVAVTGVGTNFSGTPFTVSGVTGCSITSQVINSTTSASVTIATGATTGTLTLTDTGTGATASLPVQAFSVPTISVSPIEVVTGNPVITFSGAASSGTAPYTYKIYRSPNNNWQTSTTPPVLANDSAAVLISTQTTSSAPTSYSDTTPLPGPNNYICQVTDSNGTPQTAYTNQAVSMVPVTPATFGIMQCGDSIGAGHNSTNYLQYVGSIDVTNGGANYVSPTITPSSGTATFAAVVVGGVIKYVYPTNQEAAVGYTNESSPPTFTVTDASGAGAILAVASLTGGELLAAKYTLENQYNYQNVKMLNCSVGGTYTSQWLPNGTNNGTNQGNTLTYWLESAKAAAGSGAAYPIWCFMLGANDSNSLFTKAQYKGNYQTIITNLLAFGVQKIILMCPLYTTRQPSGAGTLFLLQQYAQAIQELAAAYPGVVFAIGGSNLNVFTSRAATLLGSDGLHPTDAGYGVLGGELAALLAPILALSNITQWVHR
jgi:lysophospholipase L1-like esterase